MQKDIIIIGAGITGLSAAMQLAQRGFSVAVLEKSNRVGGQIRTFRENGFLFESGANTGSGMTEEVSALFRELHPHCSVEFARKESERRLIWKNGRFHPLPSGLWSGITTPLFTLSDKLRVLGEPFRAKGTDPDESVAALTVRRLGRSFLDYAVDPFLSGIYAGDANTLVTRHALPKLYNLEQSYGSFIGGSIKKAKETRKARGAKGRTERSETRKARGAAKATEKIEERKGEQPAVQKAIFSANGGMEKIAEAMAKRLHADNIFLSCEEIVITPDSGETSPWQVRFTQHGTPALFRAKQVITTVGAHALPPLLPFIDEAAMRKIANLRYAPIVQIAVGVKERGALNFDAFGGLVGSKEGEDFLGILFPSACFSDRCPENGALFSFFMGGTKRSELTALDDNRITEKTIRALHHMLGFPPGKEPDLLRIFRHKHAIPQYEQSSDERLQTVARLEKRHAGLHLAGNLRDGIGVVHRIEQGIRLGKEVKAADGYFHKNR